MSIKKKHGAKLTKSVTAIIKNSKSDGTKATARIPTLETLEDLYSNKLPEKETTIDKYIEALRDKAIDNVKEANSYLRDEGSIEIEIPTAAAFNNCNGKWTEAGYAVYVWNCLAEINNKNRDKATGNPYDVYVYVKLPNRKSHQSDWTQLLTKSITERLTKYPEMQKEKIKPGSPNYGRKFELISSNPDAVILKFDDKAAIDFWKSTKITKIDLFEYITNINTDTVEAMDSLFEKLKEKVLPSKNLQCFISIKRSIRPDRRYQWVHEGEHVKTILQWMLVYSCDSELSYDDLKGKYFAVSLSKISEADKEAMDEGHAGSIVSPLLEPVWAVDKLYECLSFEKVKQQIEEMLNLI